MTEKDFLRKLESMDEIGDEVRDLCKEALRLAKERGAKFDPEPALVDLPRLRIFQLGNSGYDVKLEDARLVDGNRKTYNLSYAQAKEVLYRCRKWNLIRNIVDSMASQDENPGRYDALLNILDVRVG